MEFQFNFFKKNLLLLPICMLPMLITTSCNGEDDEDNRLEGPTWTQIRTQFIQCDSSEDNMEQDLVCDDSNCFTVRFFEGMATFTELENGAENVQIWPYFVEGNHMSLQIFNATFVFNEAGELIISSESSDGCTLVGTWER